MDEPRRDETPRRYDDTNNPNNPPNSMLDKRTRRAAVWSYFVPIVALFVVVGIALLYWANRPAHSDSASSERAEVGTIGSTEGGFDPQSTARPGTTREELDQRGGDLGAVTSLDEIDDLNARAAAGRRVMLSDVEVDSAQGTTLWVRDDTSRVAVIPPAGAPAATKGARIDVSGSLEPDGQGGVQIRADRISTR